MMIFWSLLRIGNKGGRVCLYPVLSPNIKEGTNDAGTNQKAAAEIL